MRKGRKEGRKEEWATAADDDGASRIRISEFVKYVSKVRGQLCDSRKSYIASVTIHPEGRQ